MKKQTNKQTKTRKRNLPSTSPISLPTSLAVEPSYVEVSLSLAAQLGESLTALRSLRRDHISLQTSHQELLLASAQLVVCHSDLRDRLVGVSEQNTKLRKIIRLYNLAHSNSAQHTLAPDPLASLGSPVRTVAERAFERASRMMEPEDAMGDVGKDATFDKMADFPVLGPKQ